MTFDDKENNRKTALDVFIRSMQAAPDSLIKSLTGKEFAKHVVEGAEIIESYIYPKS